MSTSRSDTATTAEKKNEDYLGLTRRQLSALALQVENALGTGWRNLRFESDLEKVFENETGVLRNNQISLFMLISILIYDCFLVIDQGILKDVFQISMVIRLGLITPVGLFLFFFIRRGQSQEFRETSTAVFTTLYGLSIIYIMSVSNDPNKVFYHPALLLNVIFCNLVLRLRFWYALAASTGLFFIYVSFYPNLATLPLQVKFANIAMLFCCNVLTLYANYALEFENRVSFLYSLRERIHRGELAHLNKRLSRLVLLDPLTKLANRREIDDFINQIGESPYPDSIAVIMLDIDYFKNFNDTYGHPAGDECLKQVSRVLRKTIQRKGDIAGRIGGEEFVVFLIDANLDGGRKKAEEIRKDVLNLSIPHGSSDANLSVTVSCGVASGKIHNSMDVKNLLMDADEALYLAKKNGRNQTRIKLP